MEPDFLERGMEIIQTVSRLKAKGKNENYCDVPFMPEGDHLDNFRAQIHELTTIYINVDSMSLEAQDKQELKDALEKARVFFLDIQNKKVELSARYDWKDAFEKIYSKRKEKLNPLDDINLQRSSTRHPFH